MKSRVMTTAGLVAVLLAATVLGCGEDLGAGSGGEGENDIDFNCQGLCRRMIECESVGWHERESPLKDCVAACKERDWFPENGEPKDFAHCLLEAYSPCAEFNDCLEE